MVTETRKTLEEHLSTEYPFNVIADPDGGYVVVFPDLPGCLTQVESLAELPAMVEDAKRAWMTSVFEAGQEIPPPSRPDTEYSGKFIIRAPRSLHRQLSESAEREGVSLNQYLVMLLARAEAEVRMGRRPEPARM